MHSKFFFFLVGSNPALATKELKCLLNTYGLHYSIKISKDKRIAEIDFIGTKSEKQLKETITTIMKRITMTHFCLKGLFSQHYLEKKDFIAIDRILLSLQNVQLADSMKRNNTTFAAYYQKIGIIEKDKTNEEITKSIGELILKQRPYWKVNLKNPQLKFFLLISNWGYWFGELFLTSYRKTTVNRSPHDRPYFHPSSMNPELQRTMINLAMLQKSNIMLDPFCGVGGALLEAVDMGILPIGIEIDRKIIWGAKKNIDDNEEARRKSHIIYGDSKYLCIAPKSIDAVVTDPPYGNTTSTQGMPLEELLKMVFTQINDVLTDKGRVVICLPSTVEIEEELAAILKASFSTFYQYVHRSLTRKVVVFQKK